MYCNSPDTKLEAEGRESQWWAHAAQQDRVMRALHICSHQTVCVHLGKTPGGSPHIECTVNSKSTYAVCTALLRAVKVSGGRTQFN